MTEGEPNPVIRPRRSKWKVILLGAFVTLAILVSYAIVWSHLNFPYGPSHACSKALGGQFRSYAKDHEHWLPHGEKTPEASLALLYKENLNTHYAVLMLSGKNIPHDRVAAAIKQSGTVSFDTCGWHYVEGLRDDDDPQIAVAWDKVTGLDHNGRRRPSLMHEVILVDGADLFIGTNAWTEFTTKQKKLLEDTYASRATNVPAIRWSDEESLGPNRFTLK